jgi:2,3-bisphosphoglycerate-independent phosphoglycerate mutase
MGNSEVGHLNIGAGRVVYQDIVSINLAFETASVVKNPALVEAAKRPAKKFHLLG